MGLAKTDFGHVTYTPLGSDRPAAVIATRQCCHCHRHWIAKPSALIVKALMPNEAAEVVAQGRAVRGVCGKCGGIFCSPECAPCVHRDQKLENIEAGRDENYKPIRVFT